MIERIRKVFSETLLVDPNVLSLDSSTKNLRQWDSMKQVEIMMALEQEFGVKFKVSELVQLTSIGRILEILEKKTEKANG